MPAFLVPLVAIVPALAILVFDLARFESYFRHEGLFFGLIAGVVVGFVVVVLEGLFGTYSSPLFLILAAPLIEQMVLVAIAGLPRYRNQPAAVWYGGAAGLGLSALVLLGFAQRDAADVATGLTLVKFAMAAVGATLLHYAAGMVAGYGAAKDRLLALFPLGYFLLLPGSFFIVQLGLVEAEGARGEILRGVSAPFQGAMLWAVLLLAYGLLMGWYVARRAHELGVPPDAQKAVRRDKRKRMRGAAP